MALSLCCSRITSHWELSSPKSFACAARASIADDNSSVTYRWDEDYLHRKYEVLNLKIVHPRMKTGFEESKDIIFQRDDLVAGRYQVPFSCAA